MYVGLATKFTTFDRENPKDVIQYYRLNDTTFKHDFAARYKRKENGDLNNEDHINELLYSIYYAYKFSNQSLCKNFKLVMSKTFSASIAQIRTTPFYKEHRQLIDGVIEKPRHKPSFRW